MIMCRNCLDIAYKYFSLCYRWQSFLSCSLWQQLSCWLDHSQVRQVQAPCTCNLTLYIICQTLVDAQEVIRNFEANKNGTHITFSWDIVDGYDNSSYISSFEIYFKERPNTGSRSYSSTISYSSSSLIKNGPSFQYTTTVTRHSSYGHQFVTWVYVYRPTLNPSYAYSDQIYVEMGEWTEHTASNYWDKAWLVLH